MDIHFFLFFCFTFLQYGFMPRKSTTDAIFALRILMEKYRDGQRELHCVFVDLEKAYDRVPREELWYCMRKSGVAEKYVRVVQDMYERSRTVVRCAVGQTEEFKVEVGLHQGSALSPFLFAIVMDQLSEEVRQESPWTMMFADDIVICSESREQVEENLERWRFALERRGMKVSGSKTEYMCVNEREGSGTVRLQGEEVKKVQEFKYLGSTVQSNGECGKEVKKRVQAGWNGWRKVSGVLCERKISVRIKGKVYRTVVRAAMLYGLETVSLRKRQESELEVAELKMLREARLRWFGHVQRRETQIPEAQISENFGNQDPKAQNPEKFEAQNPESQISEAQKLLRTLKLKSLNIRTLKFRTLNLSSLKSRTLKFRSLRTLELRTLKIRNPGNFATQDPEAQNAEFQIAEPQITENFEAQKPEPQISEAKNPEHQNPEPQISEAQKSHKSQRSLRTLKLGSMKLTSLKLRNLRTLMPSTLNLRSLNL
ncbi:hypothetical protein QTP86_005435 [Hemibagrus guttatus]|nr:hypothetical protein QTP86_005435 [Hemibagrus guttatus]